MEILPATKLVTNIGRMKPCIAGAFGDKPVLLKREFAGNVVANVSFDTLPACAICVEWSEPQETMPVFVDPRGLRKDMIEEAVSNLRGGWRLAKARDYAVLRFRTLSLTMHFERIPAYSIFTGLGYGGSPFFRQPLV